MVMFLFVVAYLGGRADAPWAGGPPLLRSARRRRGGVAGRDRRRARSRLGRRPDRPGPGLGLLREPGARSARFSSPTTCWRSRSRRSCYSSPRSAASCSERHERRKRSVADGRAGRGWYLIVAARPLRDRRARRDDAAQPADRPALARDHAERGEPHLRGVRAPAGNLDGQIFALAVMAVAAAEVAIGLGLIVAMARRRCPRRRPGERATWLSHDDRRRLDLPPSPLVAALDDHRRRQPHLATCRGLDLDARDLHRLRRRARRLHRALGGGPVRSRAGLDGLHLARRGRLPRSGADPPRHTLEHDDADRLRRRRAHRLVLDGLPGRRRRGAALLRVHLALRLLDAPARAGGQLPPPARRLGSASASRPTSSSAFGTTSAKPSPRPRRRS